MKKIERLRKRMERNKIELEKLQKKEEESKVVEEVAPPEKKEVGLKEMMSSINQKLEKHAGLTEKKKSKMVGINFPFKIKMQMRKAWKRDKIPVIYLRRDKVITTVMGERKSGNIIVNGVHHDGSEGFTWLWRGRKPVMVIPEWDIKPIGTLQHEEAIEGGRTTDYQKVAIRAIKMEQQGDSKKVNFKTFIFIGIGAIIMGYLFFANQG